MAERDSGPPSGDGAGPRPLRIRDWPADERPRERLLRLGPAALADAELLAIVLRTGRAGETALDLARRVLGLGREAGLVGVAGLHPEELAALPGVGPAKAAQLQAALELGRRAVVASRPSAPRFRGPEDVAAGLVAEMGVLDREQFRVLLLDSRHGLIGTEVVAVGGLDHVPADPREVFKPAVRRSAAALIAVHNHPSGDPEPSARDLSLTQRLRDAGRVLGIPLLDHIVVARGGYVSLAARGLVD